MVWVVEARTPPVSRANLVTHLVLSEMRQFWWMQPAVLVSGLAVWAMLAAVTARVSTDARPDGVIFNYMGSLLLSLFPVLLNGSVVAGFGSRNRLEFWIRLPISHRTINLVRILGVAVNVWPVIVTWPLIISLLSRVYGPVSPWVVINSGLLAAIGVVLSTRTQLAPIFVYILLPIQISLSHFIPGARPIGDAWANGYTSPWTGIGLLVATTGLVSYVLNSHPARTFRNRPRNT